ncbi:hypothetical protein G6F59_017838 [Rhizopus arrhizus]|nr:hypothetical protein G6F59_017838 [Rhizopus arrhizus]
MTSNPTNSNVQGLYQYDASTWDFLGHGALDRSSTNDQIAAIRNDSDYPSDRRLRGDQAPSRAQQHAMVVSGCFRLQRQGYGARLHPRFHRNNGTA